MNRFSLIFIVLFQFWNLSATSISVNTVLDFVDGTCMDGSCSLRDAIQIAEEGDTILVPAGFYSLNLGQLEIDQNITIVGAVDDPPILDGNAAFRVLRIENERHVHIYNMIVQNGYQDNTFEETDQFWNAGAGILNLGNLFLENVIVRSNYVDVPRGAGGGIFTKDSLILNRCQILNNETLGEAAGIYAMNIAYLQINNSYIDGNHAKDGSGGGIQTHARTIITNTTISNNRSETFATDGTECNFDGGGGFHMRTDVSSPEKVAVLENVTISGNTSSNIGGGIFVYARKSSINQGSLTLINCTIINNESEQSGGGVKACEGANLHLFSTVIANNTAASGGQDLEISTPLVDNVNNLVEDCGGDCPVFSLSTDPALEPLGGNGGFAPTHLPFANSPLIDAGNCAHLSMLTDQRGIERPVDFPDSGFPNVADGCDIGAVELTEADIVSTHDILPAIQLSIYPNPSRGIFHIEKSTSDKIELIEVYDNLGRLSYFDDNGNHLVDLSSQCNGVYFLSVNLNTGQILRMQLLKY